MEERKSIRERLREGVLDFAQQSHRYAPIFLLVGGGASYIGIEALSHQKYDFGTLGIAFGLASLGIGVLQAWDCVRSYRTTPPTAPVEESDLEERL